MKIWKRETEWREKTIKQLLDYLYQTYHIIISLIVVDDEEDEEEERDWNDEEEEECDEEGCRDNAELISEEEDGIAMLESKCTPICVLWLGDRVDLEL